MSALSRDINTKQDKEALQNDLDELQAWERRWHMEFNPEKCQAMRVTLRRNTGNPTYSIHGQELEVVTKAKYLGLTISKNLSWSEHIAATTKKAETARSFLILENTNSFQDMLNILSKWADYAKKSGVTRINLGARERGIFGPFDTFRNIAQRFGCDETI